MMAWTASALGGWWGVTGVMAIQLLVVLLFTGTGIVSYVAGHLPVRQRPPAMTQARQSGGVRIAPGGQVTFVNCHFHSGGVIEGMHAFARASQAASVTMGCAHPAKVAVESIVTGELLAHWCPACETTLYAP
jgi:hypothetical protein